MYTTGKRQGSLWVGVLLSLALAAPVWADSSMELLETQLALANTQIELLKAQFPQLLQRRDQLQAELDKKKAEVKPPAPKPEENK